MTVKDPSSVGVPEITPADVMVTPAGNAPETLENVISRLPVRVTELMASPSVPEIEVDVAEIWATG